MQELPADGERTERRDAAGQHAGQERDARRERRAAAAGVTGTPDRLDHREPAGRPRPGEADQQGGGRERQLQWLGGQHGTLVWKYMTQKTLRPLKQ
jgi:hypothetical protein